MIRRWELGGPPHTHIEKKGERDVKIEPKTSSSNSLVDGSVIK